MFESKLDKIMKLDYRTKKNENKKKLIKKEMGKILRSILELLKK
jgi:hypothetical protein